MMRVIFYCLLMSVSCIVHAKRLPEYSKHYTDFSGVYTCTGNDVHDGKYQALLTMTLKAAHSKGNYASYDVKFEVAKYGQYSGSAVGNGNVMAFHYGKINQTTKDFGTGITKFKINQDEKISFHQFYYVAEYQSGNTGVVDCVRKD